MTHRYYFQIFDLVKTYFFLDTSGNYITDVSGIIDNEQIIGHLNTSTFNFSSRILNLFVQTPTKHYNLDVSNNLISLSYGSSYLTHENIRFNQNNFQAIIGIVKNDNRIRVGPGSPALTVPTNNTVTLTGTFDYDMTTFDGTTYGNVPDPTILLNSGSNLVFDGAIDIFATSSPGTFSAIKILPGNPQSITKIPGSSVNIIIPRDSGKLFVENLGTTSIDFSGFRFWLAQGANGVSYDEGVYNFDGDFSGGYPYLAFEEIADYCVLKNYFVGRVTVNDIARDCNGGQKKIYCNSDNSNIIYVSNIFYRNNRYIYGKDFENRMIAYFNISNNLGIPFINQIYP
jgi:hypothetical protein